MRQGLPHSTSTLKWRRKPFMTRQIYTAESRVHHFGDVIREMLTGMLSARYVAYRLAIKDIKRQYSNSMFGFMWDFIDPLVLGLIFYYLRSSNIFSSGDHAMPYPVFLIYGLMLYQTFVQATQLSVNIILSSGGLLTQQRVSPEALVLSVFFRALFFSLFRLAVMLLFSLVMGAYSIIGILLFLAAFPGIILAGMAIGIALAPFNTLYRDVGRFVNVVLVPLRFISPVFYILPATKVFAILYLLNPFAVFLDNLRMLAYDATLVSPMLLAVHAGVLLLVGLVGWFVFHISIRVLAERV